MYWSLSNFKTWFFKTRIMWIYSHSNSEKRTRFRVVAPSNTQKSSLLCITWSKVSGRWNQEIYLRKQFINLKVIHHRKTKVTQFQCFIGCMQRGEPSQQFIFQVGSSSVPRTNFTTDRTDGNIELTHLLSSTKCPLFAHIVSWSTEQSKQHAVSFFIVKNNVIADTRRSIS